MAEQGTRSAGTALLIPGTGNTGSKDRGPLWIFKAKGPSQFAPEQRQGLLHEPAERVHGGLIMHRRGGSKSAEPGDGWRLELRSIDGKIAEAGAKLVLDLAGPWVDDLATRSGTRRAQASFTRRARDLLEGLVRRIPDR